MLDGNPSSTTGLMGRQAFHTFALSGLGLPPLASDAAAGGDDPVAREGRFGIYGLGETYSASDFDGYSVGGGLQGGGWFNNRVGISITGLAVYSNIEDADVYHTGTSLGIPIVLVDRAPLGGDNDKQFTWTLTPFGTLAAGGSTDFAAGGLLFGGGVASGLVADLGRFRLGIGNQIVFYEGIPFGIDEYKFDPDLSQQLLSNGVTLGYTFGQNPGGGAWFVVGGVSYHRYLDDAAVQDWLEPTAGLGYRFASGGGIEGRYAGTFGDDFDGHRVTVTLRVGF